MFIKNNLSLVGRSLKLLSIWMSKEFLFREQRVKVYKNIAMSSNNLGKNKLNLFVSLIFFYLNTIVTRLFILQRFFPPQIKFMIELQPYNLQTAFASVHFLPPEINQRESDEQNNLTYLWDMREMLNVVSLFLKKIVSPFFPSSCHIACMSACAHNKF